MADLEQLNFKLVIDDGEFDKKVNKLKTDAKKLNTELSNLLSIQANNRIVTQEELNNAEKMNTILKDRNKVESLLNNRRKKRIDYERQITEELQKQSTTTPPQVVNISNTVDASKNITSMRVEQEGFNKELGRSSKLWMDLKNIATAYFSIAGASRLLSNMVRVSAEFEKQRISLSAILRDINGADTLFERIKQLAVVSPFNFKELVSYTKQLSAFSVPMSELYDTTKMLADVSAGLGVGMNRLILAYGQIRSASFLRGQEVRQLTEAGVPVLDELSRKLTEIEGKYVSVGEVFDKISKRQVTFEMIKDIFVEMTSEGGKFYKMQETLADTLSGKLSNLKDKFEIMFSEIGKANDGVLKDMVDAVASLAESYEEIGKLIKELAITFGIYKASLLAVKIAQQAMLEASLAKALVGDISTIRALTASLEVLIKNTKAYAALSSLITKLNPYAAIAAAATAIGFITYKIITYETEVEKLQKSITEVTDKYAVAVRDEADNLAFLFSQLEKAKVGTEEYVKVKKTLLGQYGQYLSDIAKEGLEVGKTAQAYRELAAAITESSRAKYLEEGKSEIQKYYNSILEENTRKLNENLKRLGISATGSIAQQLKAYIRGEIGLEDLTKEARDAYNKMVIDAYKASYKIGKTLANPERMHEAIVNAKQVVEEETKGLVDGLEYVFTVDKGEAKTELKGWRKDVSDIVKKANELNVSTGITIDRETSLDALVTDVANKIKETRKNIELYNGLEDDTAAVERQRLQYLEQINRVLKNKATVEGGISSPTEEKVPTWITKEIEAYRNIYSWYEKLRSAGMTESEAGSLLTAYFPTWEQINNLDKFRAKMEELINKVAQYSTEKADEIRKSLGFDGLTDELNTFKVLGEYQKGLATLFSNQDLSGEGAEFNITKILADYKKKLKVVMDKKAELRQQAEEAYNKSQKTQNPLSQDWLNAQYTNIDEAGASAIANILAETNEAIRKQGDDWVKNWDKISKYDISHMADMSVRQLRNLKKELESFQLSDIPDSIKQSLESAGLDIEVFIASVLETINKLLGVTNNELSDTLIKELRDITGAINDALGKIKEYGDTVGDSQLSFVASKTSEALSATMTIAEKLAEGDTIGAIVAGIAQAASWILEGCTQAAQLKQELQDAALAAYEYRLQLELADGITTLWGDNTYRALQNSVSQLKKLDEQFTKFEKNIIEYNRAAEFATAANQSQDSLWINMSQALKSVGYEDLQARLDKVNEILDSYNNGGKYKNLAKIYVEALKEHKAELEQYIEAQEQFEQAISDSWSNIASNIADSMINAYLEIGDATQALGDDMQSIFSEISKGIAKNLISSILIDAFGQYTEDLKKIYYDMALDGRNSDSIAAQLAELASNITESAKDAAEFTNEFLDALRQYGIDLSDSSAETLGNGIKSITEDTANLLASYVNGIRADVAYNKGQLEKILGILPNSPTLAEYLTQIQANTFNTAQHTQDILIDLRSMMTSQSGEPSLRVFTI